MGDKSTIEWTDATWNVFTGCTKVSPGCANCYIDRTPPFRIAGRKFDKAGHVPLVMHPDRMDRPLRWKRPRKIFVNSLSDVFHEHVKEEIRDEMFDTMMLANWHVFQVLTKREQSMLEFFAERPKFSLPKHIWMGVTAENAHWVKVRGEALEQVPAEVRWLSIEPQLDDVREQLDRLLSRGRIHWVVDGFESGSKRRPMAITKREVEMARGVRDVCAYYGVPYLFKQWGGPSAKSGGRLLDGRTHDGYPKEAR